MGDATKVRQTNLHIDLCCFTINGRHHFIEAIFRGYPAKRAWRVGPFWQDTLDLGHGRYKAYTSCELQVNAKTPY